MSVPKFGSFKSKRAGEQQRCGPSLQHGDTTGSPTHGRKQSDRDISTFKTSVRDGERSDKQHDLHGRSREPQRHIYPKEHTSLRDTVTLDQLEVSDLYIFDHCGDAKNLEYGSLHRYDIPSYHRSGYGRLVGTNPSLRIDRGNSSEKQIVLRTMDVDREKRAERPLTATRLSKDSRGFRLIASDAKSEASDRELRNDFIAFRTSRKRKRNDISPIPYTTEDDYRSIECKAKPTNQPEDEDLEFISESDNDDLADQVEAQTRLQNANLSRKTKEQPFDVHAWLDLVEHQRKMIRPDADILLLTSSEKRALADMRVSIFDQALKHFKKDKVGHERLVLGMIEEGSIMWERSKLRMKWREALKENPSSIPLWTKYLDFVQTDHVNFNYEECKTTYIQCLKVLHDTRSHLPKDDENAIDMVQVYVLLRFTSFVRDAGYDELANAIWQILLEFHFFKPHADEGTPAVAALEALWDSDTPRIGEEGGFGWHKYRRHGKHGSDYSNLTTVDPINPSQTFVSFIKLENELSTGLHLPGAPNDDDEQAGDPFRFVMFSDIKDVVVSLPNMDKLALLDGFLTFMHLPRIPVEGEDLVNLGWRSDQFLHLANTSSFSREHSKHTQHFGNLYVLGCQMTTYLLFQENIDAFKPGLVDDGIVDAEALRFADHVLEKVVAVERSNDAIAGYYLAFKARMFPETVVKTAKRLLKARATSLRLYNAYALAEAKVGSQQKAREVWINALKMNSGHEENARDDLDLLWHSRIRSELHCGSDAIAMQCLIDMSKEEVSALTHGTQDVLFSPPQKLRASRYLETSFERMFYLHRYSQGVLYAECLAWLLYLTEGNDLQSALATSQKYSAKLEAQSATRALELLHQTKVELLQVHLDRKRPYKPAIIRDELAKSLDLFPNNSIILGLYASFRAHFCFEDRMRATLRDEILSGRQATLVGWSFALAEELRRCCAAAGSTENSVRSTFTRALLSPDSQVKHSPHLWAMWLRFELDQSSSDTRYPGQSVKGLTSLTRAKQVFLDGLRHLPWHKGWIIMGLSVFVNEGGMSQNQLRQVYDVLAERELRVRVNVDEIEDALARSQD